jgi:hypothetical protein
MARLAKSSVTLFSLQNGGRDQQRLEIVWRGSSTSDSSPRRREPPKSPKAEVEKNKMYPLPYPVKASFCEPSHRIAIFTE